MFDQAQARPVLGPVSLNTSIKSARGPFKTVPQVTVYPKQVVHALIGLYAEYNKAFVLPVARNREGNRGYRHCGLPGTPKNWFVQIDMLGLPQEMLDELSQMSVTDVRKVLRRRIFEIENSVAMYELLQDLFPASLFKTRFRHALGALRNSLGTPNSPKQIALLAVTQPKYDAMLADEFGLPPGTKVSDDVVKQRTGFDCMWGPAEFLEHLHANDGACTAALYVRPSNPIAKQKDPTHVVEHPLLSNPDYRKLIRDHAVTLNIDDPTWNADDPRSINDSKDYLWDLGMGFIARDRTSILPATLVEHVGRNRRIEEYIGPWLQPDVAAFIEAYGIDSNLIASGAVRLRAKPLQGTYGCYGHFTGQPNSVRFMNTLAKEIKRRGPYMIQPELALPVENVDGVPHRFIDRVFISGAPGQVCFLDGFRSYMRADSTEAEADRNHGNAETVWGSIVYNGG